MLGNTSGTNFWLLLVTRVIQQAKVIYSIFLSVVFLSTPGMTQENCKIWRRTSRRSKQWSKSIAIYCLSEKNLLLKTFGHIGHYAFFTGEI